MFFFFGVFFFFSSRRRHTRCLSDWSSDVCSSDLMLLTVMAAWLYALVTGWGAPCVRSAAGLTLFMVCGYFYRKRRPLNLLAAVALAFLICDPDQLFDASFQLTFLAVAFLGAFATP